MTGLLQEDHDKEKKHLDEENLRLIKLYDAFKKVFGGSEGRKVLKHIADECGYWDTIFTGNSKTFYKSGKQDMGAHLINMVKVVDFDSIIWLEAQHANELSDNLNDQIKSVWESRKAK